MSIKNHVKSKTVKWGWLLAGLQAANVKILLLQPVINADLFAYISLGLMFINAAGAHYIRTQTVSALEDK